MISIATLGMFNEPRQRLFAPALTVEPTVVYKEKPRPRITAALKKEKEHEVVVEATLAEENHK